jgi:hypothetical protein
VESLTTVPPQVRKEVEKDLTAAATINAVEGWLNISPPLAKEKILAGQFDEGLPAAARLQLLSNADVLIRGIETEKRIQREEENRQRVILGEQVLSQAIIDAHSPDPKERLTASGVTALAMKRHGDGSPIISPAQVDGLYSLVERVAKGETIETPIDVVMSVVPRLNNDTISEAEILDIAIARGIDRTTLERWLGQAKEGSSVLRSRRDTSMRSVPSLLGTTAQFASEDPEFGKFYKELDELVSIREEGYREKKQSAVDYYTSGEFEKDVASLSGKYSILGGGKAQAQGFENVEKARYETG